MYEKILSIARKMPFLSGDSSFAQLIRTYIVGGFNLVFGLGINYIFQFFILSSIEFPLRTYLTNVFAFSIGVVVSYFLSRKIIEEINPGNHIQERFWKSYTGNQCWKLFSIRSKGKYMLNTPVAL